jgi:hypothetical protein
MISSAFHIFNGSHTALPYRPCLLFSTLQIKGLLIMQFSSVFCYFLLGPNILLSTLFSNTIGLFFPQSEKQFFMPIKENRQTFSFYIFDKLDVLECTN